MADKTIWVPAPTPTCSGQMCLDSMLILLECSKCKRKVVVTSALIGVSHNLSYHATCAECLVVSDAFKKEYPDKVNELEKWIKE